MPDRIHNPRVIADWLARLTHKRAQRRITKAVIYICLFLVLVVVLVKPSVAVTAGVFVALLVAVIANLIVARDLVCPNCNKPPISNPALADAEDATFCPHCMHDLIE